MAHTVCDVVYIYHIYICISHAGFRLGSVQSQPVDWDEINAGMCVCMCVCVCVCL